MLLNEIKSNVIGIGGGNDVVLAHVLSVTLRRNYQVVAQCGNTKRECRGLEKISENAFHFRKRMRSTNESDYLSLFALEITVAEKDPHDVIIVRLPRRLGWGEWENIICEVKAMNIDFIIGVDTGGDALVNLSGYGRDVMMRRRLHS